MLALTDPSLKKLANEVVTAHMNKEIPLTDSVVNVAERENFKPEQIRRLVEAVNNLAFTHKFNNTEGPDRMDASEFEVADADNAIHRILNAAKDLCESSAPTCGVSESGGGISEGGPFDDLPVTRPDTMSLNPAGPEDNFRSSEEPRINGTVVIMKLRKTAEELRDRHYQHQMQFTDTFQKLATSFTRTYKEPYENFEQDAFYKWGHAAVPYLHALRLVLKKEPREYDSEFQKIARVVDSTQPNMKLLKEAMDHATAMDEMEQAIAKTTVYLNTLEK